MAVQGKFNPDSEEYRLGQNILKHRKLCSMSQMDLAAAVDIDRTAISRYENGVGGETKNTAQWAAGNAMCLVLS